MYHLRENVIGAAHYRRVVSGMIYKSTQQYFVENGSRCSEVIIVPQVKKCVQNSIKATLVFVRLDVRELECCVASVKSLK